MDESIILKGREKALERRKTHALQEDGRLADEVLTTNGTYVKLADEGNFYLFYNKYLDTYEFINGSRSSFPTDNQFGLKEYEKCFSSKKRAEEYYNKLAGKHIKL